jgi:membrane protease subunit (stomatin/prohibitin family)
MENRIDNPSLFDTLLFTGEFYNNENHKTYVVFSKSYRQLHDHAENTCQLLEKNDREFSFERANLTLYAKNNRMIFINDLERLRGIEIHKIHVLSRLNKEESQAIDIKLRGKPDWHNVRDDYSNHMEDSVRYATHVMGNWETVDPKMIESKVLKQFMESMNEVVLSDPRKITKLTGA